MHLFKKKNWLKPNNQEAIIRFESILEQRLSFTASGSSLVIHEWVGSGPPHMHVEYADDEA